MNKFKKISGIALASAAATLLLSSASTVSAESHAKKIAEVKCSGINSCKGTSACATATTSCAGQNSCKGQGWVKASKEECDTKGGKIIEG